MAEESGNKRAAVRAGVEPQGNLRSLLGYGRLGRVLLLGVVLAVVAASCGGSSGTDGVVTSGGGTGTDTATSKETVPDFSFTLYRGESKLGAETLNLSDLGSRPVVLNFWAALCPPCRAEMPDLQRFYEEFNDRVTLIGIDIGQFTGLGNQSEAKNLLSELEITYPTGFTDDGSVVPGYKVLSMPTTIFINSRGEVFKKWSGALNLDVLAEVTTKMLDQEPGSST